MKTLREYMDFIDDCWNAAPVPSTLGNRKITETELKKIAEFYLLSHDEIPVLLRIIDELIEGGEHAVTWATRMANEC